MAKRIRKTLPESGRDRAAVFWQACGEQAAIGRMAPVAVRLLLQEFVHAMLLLLHPGVGPVAGH